MRNFDANLAAELAKEILTDFYLLELQFSPGTVYFTTLDRPVAFGGHLYQPLTFQTGDLNVTTALSVDKVVAEIDNAGLQFSQYLLAADQRGKLCFISYGVLLTSGAVACSTLFNGMLGSWEIQGDNKVSLTIVNEFILWSKRALRGSGSGCPWTFKDTECAYAGVQTWCDQSWERCDTLANRDNFGGNPFVNVTAEKKIWWGRIPK
jgi:hypothetical protein